MYCFINTGKKEIRKAFSNKFLAQKEMILTPPHPHHDKQCNLALLR